MPNKKLDDIIEYSKTLKKLGALKRHEFYPILINATSFLSERAHAKQRIWHIIENKLFIPKCKMCTSDTNWRKEHGTYNTYCSSKCAHSDKKLLERARTSLIENNDNSVIFGTVEFNNKRISDVKEKYGVDNISQVQEIKDKKRLTSLSRYGVEHPMQHPEFRQKLIVTNTERDGHSNYLASRDGLDAIKQFYDNNDSSLIQSRGECEVAEFLRSLNVNIRTSDRNILSPQELDIVLPDYNIAIEYCGLYWHSEQRGKDKWYHYNKFTKCKAQGIQLLTIFEDEWLTNKELIKQKLIHILGLSSTKRIYARKCTIDVVKKEQYIDFLNTHHIQGSVGGSLCYGLYNNGELVSVMLLQCTKNKLLISRYATSCTVVGGFSKLVKHITKNEKFDELYSFSDNRWSLGELYKNNNFFIDKKLPPDYYYSPDGTTRIHKFNYRRKYLHKKLKHFDPQLSERNNCDNNGILRIWDCGKIRWVYSIEPTAL